MAASLVFRLHDGGPEVVREVLLERGWEEYDAGRREEEDWNLYWRGSAFRNSEYRDLLPWQRLNHHPKTAGITRKDCLARNLRRMRAAFGSSVYNFSPTAFILPNDYTRFLAEYDKLRAAGGPPAYWICKPVDLSRGRGIFVFGDVRDLVYDCPVIVQRYVSDPLLISGYKFDLRLYVCVTSFRPLTVYIHQEGLVRFATEKHDLSSLGNPYAHLTNTSINKLGASYGSGKGRVGRGCKWTMSKFRHFLRGQDVDELLLWQRISGIVTLTLLAVAPSAPPCPNCVELFGFDVLVDVRFKPWLLEVNCSPALTLDCRADVAVKKGLVGDLVDLMDYTSVDVLREGAYRRGGSRRTSLDHPSHVPALSRGPSPRRGHANETSRAERTKQRPSRQRAFVADYQRHLPPVGRAGVVNTSGSRGDRSRNVIPGPRSRTNASTANVPRPAGWKLPNIYSRSQRPERIDGTAAPSGQHVPPLRVGDFIRTFPFNAATLKASRHELDVATVVQELHRLTGRLASGRSDGTRRRTEEEARTDADGEDDFDSLLWGPKDPPLLSRCFKPSETTKLHR
ncbi:probable tubulin polyglutamylase TTLL2 [Embiotoca jacksoni]|uniref:probable tubulin polyglutamylase TTLL2 n=1 Tax=Embiotoca jacksoni TaxID=100190 RepID=UPI003703BD9B